MCGFGIDVIHYAVYKHAQNLNGTLAERIKSSANYYGIELGSLKNATEGGERLHSEIPYRSPMTGINKDLLFDFYLGSKTHDEIVVLLAHLAIKSILGEKSFCRITTDYLFCRMAGYPSMSDMPEVPVHLRPYATRRKMDRIKTELTEFYGLNIYARYTRGFFVSFTLSLEDLIREVETKRKKYYEANQKAETSAAVLKVINQLYGNGKDKLKP
jgi:hypothetical protein